METGSGISGSPQQTTKGASSETVEMNRERGKHKKALDCEHSILEIVHLWGIMEAEDSWMLPRFSNQPTRCCWSLKQKHWEKHGRE